MSKIFEVISFLEAGSGVGGGALQPQNVSELNSSESEEVLFDFLAIVSPFDLQKSQDVVELGSTFLGTAG